MWLKIKIMAAFAAFVAVPLAAGACALWLATAPILGEAATQNLRTATASAAAVLEERLALDLNHLRAWGTLPVMQDALIGDDGGDIAQVIAELKRQYPDFADLVVTDARGAVIAATSKEDLGRNLAADKAFLTAASGAAFQSEYGFRRDNATETIWFAVPLIASYDGQTVIGTLTGALDFAAVAKTVKAQSAFAARADALAIALRDGGRIVFSSRSDEAALEALQTFDAKRSEGEVTINDTSYFVASAPSKGTKLVRDPGFVVRAMAPAAGVYGYADFLTGVVALFAGAAAVGALALVWRFAKPMADLNDAMNRLARGDVTVRAPAMSLKHPLNDMARALETFRQTKSVHDWLAAHERELLRAKEGAEQALRAKSEHLASLARALKSQISTIVELSEAINIEALKTVAAGKRSTHAQDINRCGTQLLSVINDLFELSEAEAGHLPLRDGPIDLGLLARESIAVMREAADKAKVSISGGHADNVMIVRADAQKMKQVMFNLLSNAVKFTPERGYVRVHLKVAADGRPTIAIEDTGIGMSPNLTPMAAAVLNNSGGAHGQHGAGFGLPLVRRLVAMHGGTLEIESEAGKGTTVTVALPADRLIADEASERRIA